MTKVISGLINQKIEIFTKDAVADGYGGTTPKNISYWQTRAQVVPLKSARTLQANQEVLKDGFSFFLRYRSDKSIQEGMMIQYRGSWLTIISAVEDYVYKTYVKIVGVWVDRPEAIALDETNLLFDQAGNLITDYQDNYFILNWQ